MLFKYSKFFDKSASLEKLYIKSLVISSFLKKDKKVKKLHKTVNFLCIAKNLSHEACCMCDVQQRYKATTLNTAAHEDTIRVTLEVLLKLASKHSFLGNSPIASVQSFLWANADKSHVQLNYVTTHKMLRDLYFLFYNAGMYGITFWTLASKPLYKEAIAINHYVCNIQVNSLVNIDLMREGGQGRDNILRIMRDTSFDFLFIVNTTLKGKELISFTRGNEYVVALLARKDDFQHVDTCIPVANDSVELQYYFMEFALSGLLAGRKLKTLESAKLYMKLISTLY